MKCMAHVVSIVYRPRKSGRPHDRFERVPADRVQLVESQGIEGDLKGTKDRQLNIMLAETLADLSEEGFSVGPGQMGEQIVIAGLDSAALTEGTRLRIGEVVVEVGIPRTGCVRFEQIQGKSRRDADGRLGFMAAVVAGGTVAMGDAVELIAVSPKRQ